MTSGGSRFANYVKVRHRWSRYMGRKGDFLVNVHATYSVTRGERCDAMWLCAMWR